MRPFLPALLLLIAGCASDPDLVIHNARVFTADPANECAEAVLIRGERIAVVGSNDDILAAAGANARLIDAEGRLVIPGLNDAHAHVSPSGPSTRVTWENPTADPPSALVLDSLRAAVARAPEGQWIDIPVSEAVLNNPQLRRDAVDAIAPDNPVALAAWSGHGIVYNSAALAALDVSDSVSDPLGGWFERDADGRLTGRVDEYAAYALLGRRTGAEDPAVLAGALVGYANMVSRWGVTSVQNMVTGIPPDALADVLTTLDAPIRYRFVPWPMSTPAGRDLAPWDVLRFSPGSGSFRDGGLITVSGIKYILDGTPIERLAAMRRPYADHPTGGTLNFSVDTLRAILTEALASRTQPLFHAVGDSTIATILRVMEEIAPDSAWPPLRLRIEHGDGLAPDLLTQARRLGIVVVQNPSHFTAVPEITSRLEPERRAGFMPMRSLIEADIPVAIGSDGPPNPFLNIMFAVMHPVNPAEALTLAQAVRAYTWGSAYAEFAEDERGTIEPGKLADLAVLSQNIFEIPLEQLPATEAVITIVAGHPVEW